MIDSIDDNKGPGENELFNLLIYPCMFSSTFKSGLALRLTVLSLHALLEPAEGNETIEVEEPDFIAGSSMASLFCHRKILNHPCVCFVCSP